MQLIAIACKFLLSRKSICFPAENPNNPSVFLKTQNNRSVSVIPLTSCIDSATLMPSSEGGGVWQIGFRHPLDIMYRLRYPYAVRRSCFILLSRCALGFGRGRSRLYTPYCSPILRVAPVDECLPYPHHSCSVCPSLLRVFHGRGGGKRGGGVFVFASAYYYGASVKQGVDRM